MKVRPRAGSGPTYEHLPTYPAVYFGPYRTLFNAPAEVTLPYDRKRVSDTGRLRPFIYNEITGSYDPVYAVSGAPPMRIDTEQGLATLDVQVLGNFVLELD